MSKPTRAYERYLKKLEERIEQFDPKNAMCPICGKDFRFGCSHSITEAKKFMRQKLLKALRSSNG